MLAIGDMVFSSISYTKCKQKYGSNSGPQNYPKCSVRLKSKFYKVFKEQS